MQAGTTANGTAAAIAALNDTTIYTVCMGI
jgi:hypothetical protein